MGQEQSSLAGYSAVDRDASESDKLDNLIDQGMLVESLIWNSKCPMYNCQSVQVQARL